jgi:hypothetical protein
VEEALESNAQLVVENALADITIVLHDAQNKHHPESRGITDELEQIDPTASMAPAQLLSRLLDRMRNR